MKTSKTELALYGVLAVGIVVGIANDVPAWALGAWAVVITVANIILGLRQPANFAVPEMDDVRWPWQRSAYWMALVAIAVFGGVLALLATPVGLIALLCGLALVFYAYVVAREIERVRERRSGTPKRGPSVEDWTLLTVSLVFCGIAILMLRDDWRTSVVTLALFGGCALTFITIIRRKLRAVDPRVVSVSVVGGVDIFAEGQRMAPLAIGTTVVGAVLYFFGTEFPLLMRLMGAFIALVGLTLLAMIALGLLSRKSIRFEPEALFIGEKTYRFSVEWDNIAAVAEFEYANNSFVTLRVTDLTRIEVEPARRRAHLLRDTAHNNSWLGVDIVLNVYAFGIDAPILVAALTRYATDAHARQELTTRRLESAADP